MTRLRALVVAEKSSEGGGTEASERGSATSWRPQARADEVTTGLAPEQSVAVPQGAEREVLAAPTRSGQREEPCPGRACGCRAHPLGATGSLGA